MPYFGDYVFDSQGNVVPGATITVATQAGAAATIYSNAVRTTTITSLTTGSDGSYEFYIAPGRYTITAQYQGFSQADTFDLGVAGIESVTDFGADATGVVDSTAIFESLTADEWFVPRGTYKTATTVDIVTSDVALRGDGRKNTSILQSGATGNALFLDGDLIVNGMAGTRLENLMVSGAATVTNGVRVREFTRSELHNVSVKNVSAAGFSIEWAVSCLFSNLVVSVNDQSFTTQPVNGLLITSAGGSQSTNNTFLNPISEGVSGTGWKFGEADANTIIGGTSEGNTGAAFEMAALSGGNVISGAFFEANGAASTIAGFFNEIHNCYHTGQTLQFTTNSYHNRVIGGYLGNILIDAGVLSVVLENCAIATGASITNNSTGQVDMRSVWNVSNARYLPDVVCRVTGTSAAAAGHQQWVDPANKNRKLIVGIDNTKGANGTAWLEAEVTGTAVMPLDINPGGGNVAFGGSTSSGQSVTAVATTDGSTIATASLGVSRIAPAAARTGVILGVGTFAGQAVTVINEAAAANTITFAIAATSNVADGVTTIIAGLRSAVFVWDSVTALWYRS